jgi:hypothetical protein
MILSAIGILGLLVWLGLSRGLFRFASLGRPSGEAAPVALTHTRTLIPPVIPAPVQPTATPTSLRPSPSPTRTVGTSTPTIMAFHTLETPIGMAHRLIIHRILNGESLTSLSAQYWTTDEAIRLVNFNSQSPLLVGKLIIIPVDQTDVSGLPAFEAFLVAEDISVEALAKQLLVDPAVLESYNDLQAGQVLAADEWVLVPHLSPVTP